MPGSYAEARNMVFPKPAGPARSCFHENINSHQSVPVGLHLFSLRPEWISSFHSDASAQRSCGTVPRSDVRFEISPGRLWASGDFRRIAVDQSLRAARTHDSRTDHREHSLVSRPDESGRYRTGGLRHDLLGRGVCERAFGVRRSFPGAGRNQNNARVPALARRFSSLTNEPRKEKNMSRTIKAIERHMIPRSTIPPVRSANRTDSSRGELGLQPRDAKLVAEWQRGLETVTGSAQRKLRLVFAPTQSPATSN